MFIKFLYWFVENILERHCSRYIYREHCLKYKATRAEIIQFKLCSRLHFRLDQWLFKRRKRLMAKRKVITPVLYEDTF